MPQVSYATKITNLTTSLEPTLKVYRDAIRYIIDIVEIHYDELNGMLSKTAQRYIETLIHSTEQNKAKYANFDKKFYKFPSYLRRDAITTAIGLYSSYRKLVKQWEENGGKGKKPILNRNQNVMLCFYRGNTFLDDSDYDGFQIKVYRNHDWVWQPIVLKDSDLRHIKRLGFGGGFAPVLEKRHRGYSLRFTFTSPLSDKKFKKDKDVEKALGVDLGINTDAVCSCVKRDGTVIGQKFINSPIEKDRMRNMLEHIKEDYARGNRDCHKAWRYVDNYNDAIAIHTAHDIVRYAVQCDVDVIVFEHLEFKGKKHGKMAQRIALWRKREIQDRVETMASRYGIRVAYVCAKNTSALAFDGSGKVERDKHNASLCTFASGKKYCDASQHNCDTSQYNCDLSASKNIAARYFIRAIVNSITKRSSKLLQAKVPDVSKRTQCTLATLISVYVVIKDLGLVSQVHAVSVDRHLPSPKETRLTAKAVG